MGGNKMKNKSLASSPTVAPPGPGVPPIQVTRSTDGDRKTNDFTEKLCITCNTGNRSFSLELTQEGIMDHVFCADIEIEEKDDEDKTSATFTVNAKSDQEHGVSCLMCDGFSGAVEMQKEKFSFAPIPDTEIVKYKFTDLKSESCFFMQKKNKAEFVERIAVAHCFSIGEDAVYYVDIKIATGNKGLCVDVEGPLKRTKDSVEQQFSKFTEKMGLKAMQQLFNGFLYSSADKDIKLIQSRDSYPNTGMQRQMGLVNSSGFMKGIGNGGFFNNCRILAGNKKEKWRK